METEFPDNWCRWCGIYLGNSKDDLCDECKRELEKWEKEANKDSSETVKINQNETKCL